MSYAEQLGTFSITIKKRFLSITLPILICSILSSICSYVVYNFFFTDAGGGEGPPLATFTDNPFITAGIFVVIAFLGATSIFLIFKYNKIKLLRAIFAFAICVTSFFFMFLLVYSIPFYLLDYFTDNTVFSTRSNIIILVGAVLFGCIFSALTVVSMVYRLIPQPLPEIMAMTFAVLAGTFLAIFLPTLGAVLVMIGISIYDIISVFRGPIKKMAELSEQRYSENNTEEISTITETIEYEKNDESKQEISSEGNGKAISSAREEDPPTYIEYIELGLGDLAFFGMIISFTLLKLGFFSAIAAFIGVIVGAIGTIQLLKKVKMMPGLPLSIGLGLILAFGVWGILTLSGYTGWGWIYPNWYA